MATIPHRHIKDLQSILYRLLVQGTASQEPVAGNGHFLTASIADPLGTIFRRMTCKDAPETIVGKQKTDNDGNKRW